MKYKVTMTHEIMIIDASNFDVNGNMIVFYNENNKSIYAFSNIIKIEKMKEGEDK